MDQHRQSGEKRGAGGRMQPYDEHGRYSGPSGGAAVLGTGAVRVFTSSGKLAGADSEDGRKEPNSLLSATGEQLRKIGTGTGQALRQGAAGAKEALARTAHELAHNEDLHKGLEFGLKAAGEVSKDVAEKVGADALSAAFGRFRPLAGEGTAPLPGTIGGLVWKGARSYKDFPDQARDLGWRIVRVREDVYGKD